MWGNAKWRDGRTAHTHKTAAIQPNTQREKVSPFFFLEMNKYMYVSIQRFCVR